MSPRPRAAFVADNYVSTTLNGGARAIRWAIGQLRFEGATIAGLARQLATTWNTVWSRIKPCLQAASDAPARFAELRHVMAVAQIPRPYRRKRQNNHPNWHLKIFDYAAPDQITLTKNYRFLLKTSICHSEPQ